MGESKKPVRKQATKVNLWKCSDLKALIHEHVQAHVKDVALAKKLERALGDKIAYGDGGGGGHVGVA